MRKVTPLKIIISIAILLVFATIDPLPILSMYALVPIALSLSLIYSCALRRAARQFTLTALATGGSVDGDVVSVRRVYRTTLVKVTATWLSSAVILAYSTFVLKFGLGSEWHPFFRTITLRKGDPLSGLIFFDGLFVVSGFLFVSGLVWLPMYYFFERLTANQKLDAIQARKLGNA